MNGLHLGFFQAVSSCTASRESLTSSKINEVQHSVHCLFRALKFKARKPHENQLY